MRRTATPGCVAASASAGSIVTPTPRATSATATDASIVRWRTSGSKPPCARQARRVISSQPRPASPVAHASSASSRAARPRCRAAGWPGGDEQGDGVVEQLVARDAGGQADGLALPLVAEHEVEVAERERGQRLLRLGLDDLAAQPRRRRGRAG